MSASDRIFSIFVGLVFSLFSMFFIWLFFQFSIPQTPDGFVSIELLGKIMIPIIAGLFGLVGISLVGNGILSE